MWFLKGIAGGLLWLLATIVGLLGLVLSVTILLLPLGIPLLLLSRRLLAQAARLMLPRALAHPVEEVNRSKSQGSASASRRAFTKKVEAEKKSLAKDAKKTKGSMAKVG